MQQGFTRFTGQGETPAGGWENLPPVDRNAQRDPSKYIASSDLAAAVNVALTLGMPLLLTGEPGSGKSQLAYRIAWELGFPKLREHDEWPEPLRFVVKSTTEARDLFYTFDTVGRFHAAQNQNPNAGGDDSQAVNFIEYQALGLAILRAKGLHGLARDGKAHIVGEHHRAYVSEESMRSVVLIDEIDKAPRDVPNDILAELEEMQFAIPELRREEVRIRRDDEPFRPIVIITSNNERDLPEAFLRRCVYHHLPFPDDETLERIVMSRLGDRFSGFDHLLREALESSATSVVTKTN